MIQISRWILKATVAMGMLALSNFSSAIPLIAVTDMTDGNPTIDVTGLTIAIPCIVIPEKVTCSILTGSVPANTIKAVNSSFVFALTEGPVGSAAVLSDAVSVTIGVDSTGAFGVDYHFSSDVPLSSGADNPIETLIDCTQAGTQCAQETGGVQRFTVFVPGILPGSSVALFDVSIQSDLDSPPVQVTEPSTLFLLLSGLAGFFFNRGKKS